MALSFRTKLLASHVSLVVAAFVIAISALDTWLTADLVKQLDERLVQQAKGASEWSDEGGKRHPEKVAGRIARIVGAEVTLFDKDGTEIGSSSNQKTDVGTEVKQALEEGLGRSTRERVHYVAVRGDGSIVIRLAAPLSEIDQTVSDIRARMIVASAVAIAVAILLGILASRVASRPLGEMTATATRLAAGDFDVPIHEGGADEFGVLWRALGSLAQQLKARIGELVSERDQLSAILAGMAEGVLVIGDDRKVLVANPAIEKILGSKELDDDLWKVVSQATENELELVDRRGASLAIYKRPLDQGAIVVVVRDMTALRRLMRVRRDFVANLSHELRTPVTAIQGYAETLLRGTDPKTSAQFLEIIHRQSQRIGGLVEQLLALSELEARDKGDVVEEAVVLVDVANHVADSVRVRAEAKKARVVVNIADTIAVHGDGDGIERMLINLVDNAIKHGHEGGRVEVSAKDVADHVELVVEDDGPGIDAAHLGRIFERFYRVDPGRSRQQGGAGLGLSIVRHLVESMHGSITAESPPSGIAQGSPPSGLAQGSRGARFVVTLPKPSSIR